MDLKLFLKRQFYKLTALRWRIAYTRSHNRELKSFSKSANVKLTKQKGEVEFLNRWKPLFANVNVDFYRFYSRFIGLSPDIVPDDIFHIVIEPILNNQSALSIYSDKNMFEKLFNPAYFPVCILRRMEGDYMDRNYHLLDMTEDLFDRMVLRSQGLIQQGRFIVKPSVDTGGGAGVRLFAYEADGNWKSNDGLILSLKFLDKYYKNNFIIQECIEPSAFVKQFNPTSYSTLRIFTYRSVKDDTPYFIGGYMRVGAKGSFKDNVWGGGFACPINADGTLAAYAGNARRERFDNINGVSLTSEQFRIPNFDKVLDLVFDVAKANVPNRLLSFDIILDKHDLPHIIEFNIKHQTVTTVQTLQHPFFGQFTDEIIKYCMKHKSKISYQSILRDVSL